jgi:hypothetical protein
MRANFEKRLYQLENQSQQVQMENEMLKSLIFQSRHEQARIQDKVTKVLHHIVNIFGSAGNQLPPALLNSSVRLPANFGFCCASLFVLMDRRCY